MKTKTKIPACLICGSKKLSYQFEAQDRMFHLAGTFVVKKCLDCSFVFLDPQPTQEALKKYYPSKKYYAYSTNRKRGLFELLREYLIAHYYSSNFISLAISTFIQKVPAIPSYAKNGKVLDIGCGAGDTLVLLKKVGWGTYGLDMDTWALANAKKRGLKNLRLGTYKALTQYQDHYFDAIRLYHVIEHIEDPRSCLSLIRKKLKKNGELVIGTPNVGSIVSKLFGSYWYNLDAPRHVVLFSPKTLGILLEKEGFSVEKTEYCGAGGIIGSIQYFLEAKTGKKIDLIHSLFFVFLFYPFDWLLNKLGTGDVFVLRARVAKRT